MFISHAINVCITWMFRFHGMGILVGTENAFYLSLDFLWGWLFAGLLCFPWSYFPGMVKWKSFGFMMTFLVLENENGREEIVD